MVEKRHHKLIHYENWYNKKMEEALNKMYPNTDAKDKYVLFVLGKLWFPYISNSINADIDFIYKDSSIKHHKNRLRTPYPNKKITMISMTNGRKVCDLGIPIIFDTYEELSNLKSILIRWELEVPTKTKDIVAKYYINVSYDIEFKYIDDKKVYVIDSKDSVLEAYRDINIDDDEDNSISLSLNNYLDNFSRVVRIFGKGEDCSFENIKGEESQDVEIFSLIIQTLGLHKFVEYILDSENNNSNQNFIIYNYYSNLIVEPIL